jgi:hypothetical protein
MHTESTGLAFPVCEPRRGALRENPSDHIDVIEHPYMWYYLPIPA